MGRRKQARPHRSGGLSTVNNDALEAEQHKLKAPETTSAKKGESVAVDVPYYVEIDRSHWESTEHLDISEIVLQDLDLRDSAFRLNSHFYQDSKYSLRFRVCNVGEYALDRIKLGHWHVLSSSVITLEFIVKSMVEDRQIQTVICSGIMDGPDEGIVGLVHLVSIKFLTLRPVLELQCSEEMRSLRIRVEILKKAFNSCESLLENTRQLWKKSMMNIMAWLRPEVMSSEARYRTTESMDMDMNLVSETVDDISGSKKCARFDVAGFYEAIKPSKSSPMLDNDLPDLVPELRPYQRRAAYWMLQRENGGVQNSCEKEEVQSSSPLCVSVDFLDNCSSMFYNPFSGNISLCPEVPSSHIFGGILADEMGLGKTVEVLACIFAHQKSTHEDENFMEKVRKDAGDHQFNLKRLKRERVECICGAVSESSKYKGLWVQCDTCDAWQHADCVGYSTKGKKKKSTLEVQKHRKKTSIRHIELDGEYICQMCYELIQATTAPVTSGATLIICPTPILPQWHAEIERHTHPGSLKTYVYEGVRDVDPSEESFPDISELLKADIVLTTYDVLKEDLSHDSDRHQGDRHFLRFQKRYPVAPTLLTRIYWWRVCLDEAQMVESNVAAATEMAIRLSAKHRWCITGTPIQRKLDDLYGLLRFLKASPFDISRWWIDVIRDPYERRDVGAMEFTHKFFKDFMWRSSKLHVADELQLPPQEECISWLTFSAIEEHFYQRQHETCVGYAREVVESLKNETLKREVPDCPTSDASADTVITQAEAAKLLNSLLKLRQACCHPQVGSSGLRSIQQSPMSMEEILMVLISKTKIEGEEALRKLVVALNALAGIAIIEKNFSQAVLLYREALDLTEEHSKDFRLDPLLNIHIHHNLADILPMVTSFTSQNTSQEHQSHDNVEKASKIHNIDDVDMKVVKKQKLDGEVNSDLTVDAGNIFIGTESSLDGCKGGDDNSGVPESDESLRASCLELKQKYLSVFTAKLSTAQQDFKKSHAQISSALCEREDQHKTWWLDALSHAELNKDFSRDLIRKIEEAVSGILNNSRSSRVPSSFRSITSLKFHIQSRLDQLEISRQTLLNRLLEIDQTMENPKEEDIERVRYCRSCQATDDGPICIHCELEELFKDYEARLFRLNKSHGEVITSAEEAVDLQNKNSALNRFYWNLSGKNRRPLLSGDGNEASKKRDVVERVVVSKSPSELEVVLGVIRNYSKNHMGKEGISAASKQINILEAMRKEYSHARSLAVSQAQLLRAHDEIKMATSRLHLQEDENDHSVDALAPHELESASVLQTNEKFISLALLSRIKGRLRYLEGLISSKQKSSESSNNSAVTEQVDVKPTAIEGLPKDDDESCPICHEKLESQKMVFQCGHFTCCKCFFALTEQHSNMFQRKWVMCPTCRHHTDFGNVAYADDRKDKSGDSDAIVQDYERCEASLSVQGSYGTKIEAVTRRILWIKAADPEAKVLVFSSWNDVLDVLEHAFNANGITCVRMKGGRKAHVGISQFKGQNSSPIKAGKKRGQKEPLRSVQVLMLLIQHGANGLNLLEAQHVVLAEPLLNPAAEAQAIGRVHRIGQQNRTFVHRFIVKNTVEESIYKLNRSRNSNAFISGNTKNQDEPLLTLKDVESLFATVASDVPKSSNEEEPIESLRHLPPGTAAAIAAERRLKRNTT